MGRKYTRFSNNLVLDVKTGELIFKPDLIEEFVMIIQSALYKISQDRALWGTARAVLDYMLSQVSHKPEKKGEIQIEHKALAKHLGISPQAVSTNIKKLIDRKIITKGRKMGNHIPYRFSEEYVRKPKTKDKMPEELKYDLQPIPPLYEYH